MRRSTLQEFARAPLGSYVAGETFAHFCAAPSLWGLILWGRPEEHHAAQLRQSLAVELAAPAEPHASIIDASRVDSTDSGAFRSAESYLERYSELLAEWVHRLAVVRPRGLGGAIVPGAYEVLPRPYPVAIFGETAAALSWLSAGTATGWPSDCASVLSELYVEASGTPHVVAALRAFLDGHLTVAKAADAAVALGLPERTLEEKLAEARTTYTEELAEARMRAARHALSEGDAPLTTVAFEVGFASLQQFTAQFRKRSGESPNAFRKRYRSGR